MAVVGTLLRDRFRLRDASGVPILGVLPSQFTIENPTNISAGGSVTMAIVEVGNGFYEWSFTPASAGEWYAYIGYSDGITVRDWEIRETVDPVPVSQPTPLLTGTGTSRKELRRRILAGLGDLRVLTATTNGSTQTFIDAINLTGENDAYIDRQVIFTAGTVGNIGQIRHVNGSSKGQRALSFATPLPAQTMIGDELEMVNTRGTGYTIADAHRAINEAIAGAAGEVTIPASIVTGTFYEANGTIDIPTGWVLVSGVQWQDSNGKWRNVSPAGYLGGHGWFVDRGARQIAIGGRFSWLLDGSSVRVHGAMDPGPLDTDADETPVNAEWLVAEAKALMLAAKYQAHPTPERERMLAQQRQIANSLRVFTPTRRSANSVRVA